MIAGAWQGQGTLRCSTSTMGKMSNSRRIGCTRKDRQAFSVLRVIDGFQGPDVIVNNWLVKSDKTILTSSDFVSRWRYGLMDLYCL